MRKKRRIGLAVMLVFAVSGAATLAMAGGATRVAEAVWAHGQVYDTVITPTTFISPPGHSSDIIYSFMMSGLQGQRSVAEAAPGDPEYNGGRWNVYLAVFTAAGVEVHDENGDGTVDLELTSADEVVLHETLGHLETFPADFYFECPLLPRR
ncbi:MAG: hypothetical protein JSV26_06830 [bacterium]|nr:MAG: hypothetical protein JSV26_06830 [bacterium]